jgi:hypothetical protein
MILLSLAALFLVDGLAGLIGKKFNSFDAVPGDSILMAEPMPPDAETIEDLRYTSSSDGLSLTFETLFTGYFLGGARWTGKLIIAPGTAAGEYSIAVHNRADKPFPALVFTVQVFADEQALRQSSWSLSRRLGVNPFSLAGVLTIPAVLFMGISYLFSSRLEELLAASGRSEIFMVRHDSSDSTRDVLGFNLGAEIGLSPGDRVIVTTEQGREVAEAVIISVNPKDSQAVVPRSAKVKPGYIVGAKPLAGV